jgi:hypothetical protein
MNKNGVYMFGRSLHFIIQAINYVEK